MVLQVAINKGLKANEWVSSVSSLMGGKGGGKAENAQASGPNAAAKTEIITTALRFAEQKLGISGSSTIVPRSAGATLHCPSNSQVKLRSMITAVYASKTLSVVDNARVFYQEGGMELTDCTAIPYYLANTALRGGNDAFAEAQVLQWLSFANNHIQPAVASWVHLSLGTTNLQISPVKAKEEVENVMKYLNTVLLTKTYLVGERISLADIIVFTTILPAYVHVLDPETRKPHICVNRWFRTILNQPQVLKVVGSVKLCEQPAQVKKAGGKKDGKGK